MKARQEIAMPSEQELAQFRTFGYAATTDLAALTS